MTYSYSLTIPKQTSKDEPAQIEMKLTEGIIKQWEFEVPPGVNAVAGVRVMWGSFQLFPRNPESWLVSGGGILRYPENWHLEEEPYVLLFQGYNDSTRYSHTIQLRLTILPSRLARPELIIVAALGELSKVFTASIREAVRDLTTSIENAGKYVVEKLSKPMKELLQRLEWLRSFMESAARKAREFIEFLMRIFRRHG